MPLAAVLRVMQCTVQDVQALSGGRKRSGIFAADLTLEQVKELYATQTFKFRDHSYETR